VLGIQGAAVDVDGAWSRELGAALDDGDTHLGVALDLGAVVKVANHVVAVVPQLRPVQAGGGHALGPGRFGVSFGRPKQGLGRDAGPVAALAADQLSLDDSEALACLV